MLLLAAELLPPNLFELLALHFLQRGLLFLLRFPLPLPGRLLGLLDLLSLTELDDRQRQYVAAMEHSGRMLLGAPPAAAPPIIVPATVAAALVTGVAASLVE